MREKGMLALQHTEGGSLQSIEGNPSVNLDPRIERLKNRLLEAQYEICMARAHHFTVSYRETEHLDPYQRNALALQRTLERQSIQIYPDEWLAGSKTEKFLAAPLPVERGDFLRVLQHEMEILHLKQRPFHIDKEDRSLFYKEILPYWDGQTVRDRKVAGWVKKGLITRVDGPVSAMKHVQMAGRFAGALSKEAKQKLLGANRKFTWSPRRLYNLYRLRNEVTYNNPSPAAFCFDVQGHMVLGVDQVVDRGMTAIIEEAKQKRETLKGSDPDSKREGAFLDAVILSLESVIGYADRFSKQAEILAASTHDPSERDRYKRIAKNCSRVPRQAPKTFHEALQAIWLTLVAGEIQYGAQDALAIGRLDQILNPFYVADIETGRLTRDEAMHLLQELFLKLSANIDPIPEVGMETNGVLGNSQHVTVIGGMTDDGQDATNEMTYLILEAYDQMRGAPIHLSVRVCTDTPDALLDRAVVATRRSGGIAFYSDEATIEGLQSDGMSVEDARNYCIVGCIETSGHANTHGCPAGHELLLPTALCLTLSRGKNPPPSPGQLPGFDAGDPASFHTFEQLLAGYYRQLEHQVGVLLSAVAEKDLAYKTFLPAPYLSALTKGCIDSAKDITEGGAKYDFSSIAVHGLATAVDSLLAIEEVVYKNGDMTLPQFAETVARNFEGHEPLRQRILHQMPKYGKGELSSDGLALDLANTLFQSVQNLRNIRGGKIRLCYYTYGNHIIDGLLLGATPDGRRRGEPFSNGISPSNSAHSDVGPAGPLQTAAKLIPAQISSGVSLNMRFHHRMLSSRNGAKTFSKMIRTYFEMGGAQMQPNVVSKETLLDAQAHPEQYRDLLVKVAGYSAYFTDLGKSIQEDIIARQEFGN